AWLLHPPWDPALLQHAAARRRARVHRFRGRRRWRARACATRAHALDSPAMTIFGDVARWFADPAHWQGSHGIPVRVLQPLALSGLAVAIALVIAVPVALYLGHTGRGGFIAINLANIGRALPSLALIGLGLAIAIPLGLGLGFWPTMFALVPLAIPPIMTNTFVAIREVDRDVVDAARGMGLKESEILGAIELPLGLPFPLCPARCRSYFREGRKPKRCGPGRIP